MSGLGHHIGRRRVLGILIVIAVLAAAGCIAAALGIPYCANKLQWLNAAVAIGFMGLLQSVAAIAGLHRRSNATAVVSAILIGILWARVLIGVKHVLPEEAQIYDHLGETLRVH